MPARQEAAWDSGVMNYYRPEHRQRLPIAMNPGDSLASSISLSKGEKVTYPYHPGTVRRLKATTAPVKTVAVITCVASPLPPDAFRPGYCGHDTVIYLTRDLKRSLLPAFDRPAGIPEPGYQICGKTFSAPGGDAGFFSFDVPQQSMPTITHSGTARVPPMPSSWLAATASSSRTMSACFINVIQIGIDHYSLVRQGHPVASRARSATSPGRKLPTRLCRPAMLGDEDMANINNTCPNAHFGEDEQTAYGDCWTGAGVVFTGYSGIDEVTGVGARFPVRAGNPWEIPYLNI